MLNNPVLLPLIPVIPWLREAFKDLGQDELAAQVANPQLMQLMILLGNLTSPNGENSATGNGADQPALPPAGLGQAQLGGTTL